MKRVAVHSDVKGGDATMEARCSLSGRHDEAYQVLYTIIHLEVCITDHHLKYELHVKSIWLCLNSPDH